MNKHWYVNNTLNSFFHQLTVKERKCGHFQPDTATATHTADSCMDTICRVFDDRIISKGLWPSRSPDLSYYDFYLWGNLKRKLYENNLWTTKDLQKEITCAISSITEAEFQKVYQNLFRQWEACLTAEGGTSSNSYFLVRCVTFLQYKVTKFCVESWDWYVSHWCL